LDSKKLAFKIAELALTKKAEDVKVLDLRKLTPIADFFVICTAHSDPQVKAVADAILEGSKELGERVWHKEGMTQKSWILLDYVDVVVHIFLRDTRTFYGLEKLWGDAVITDVSDDPAAKTKAGVTAKTQVKTKTAVKKPKAKTKK
jgi:ribosome-associated protein